MNKSLIAKRAISIVVTAGTGKIVGDIIKNNTSPSDSVTDKVTYTVGAYALGGMIAAKTAEYTDHVIDDIFSAFRKTPIVPAESFNVND